MGTETENAVSFFRFEDLRIYAKALSYINWVYKATSTFPESAQVALTDQFIKTTQTIALNIAEGSARNKSQFIYYLKMAKSSVRDCVVYTTIATQQDLFNEENAEYSRNQLMELTKMIGSLIASLQRSIPNVKDEHDDIDEI
ncbi:MAG: four helix bundle protein [Bacteroidota bacterium]